MLHITPSNDVRVVGMSAPTCQRVDRADAERLAGEAGREQQIDRAIQLWQRGARQCAEEAHTFAQAQLGGEPLQLAALLAVASDQQRRGGDGGERADGDVYALP